MAEEAKQPETKPEPSKMGSTILKVFLGLVFLALGVLAVMKWWDPAILMLIKGCIGPFLLLAGVITLAIAKE